MNCLSEEILDTEFDESSSVWVILDKNDQSRYLLFPKNETILVLWAFLKKEDAEHLAFTLRKIAPEFKDLELTVSADSLNEIRQGAKEYNCSLCIMSPIDSKEFFDQYEQTLTNYYGLE